MPAEKGFILLYRDIDDSDIMDKPPHFRETWLWLIRNANHTGREVNGKLIRRGELKTSVNDIIQALKWYIGDREVHYQKWQIHGAIKYLRRAQMITTTKTTRGMIVKVCNYDYYQKNSTDQRQTKTPSKETPKPKSNPTVNKELNNLKKVCKSTTHTFSLDEIKKIFIEQEKELNMKAKEVAPLKFYNNQQRHNWMFDGKPIIDIVSHVRNWIIKDAEENKTTNKMIVSIAHIKGQNNGK